jgi:polysaccharide biosynthesis transport protein
MGAMADDSPLAVIWRRKFLIAGVFLLFAVTTAVISKSLEKVYSTQATLFVALRADEQTFDSVQASQSLARSFADIIDSPNMSNRVADRLADGTTAKTVGNATTFEPVPETQLLEINAEDPDPARAKRIADLYADIFVDFAENELGPTTNATVSLADPAPLRRTPARPKPTLYTLIAAMIGLALGIALAFLRDRLDRRIRTAEDIEGRFDLPVLARIPRRGRSQPSITAFKEAHRVLRTNLRFAAVDGQLRSLAVTSGLASEGKTTTVGELALASAEVGLQVVAIEADFRRPGLERLLMPERETPLQPGLSNYLVEAASIDEVIHPTSLAGVSIVPSGPLPPSPSALLDARRGPRLSAFAERADLVILDLPPLSIGADASAIANWVDGVLLVVDLGGVTDRAVREALKQLEAVRARTLGLVLNRDPQVDRGSYEYYYAAPAPADDGPGREFERSPLG